MEGKNTLYKYTVFTQVLLRSANTYQVHTFFTKLVTHHDVQLNIMVCDELQRSCC